MLSQLLEGQNTFTISKKLLLEAYFDSENRSYWLLLELNFESV